MDRALGIHLVGLGGLSPLSDHSEQRPVIPPEQLSCRTVVSLAEAFLRTSRAGAVLLDTEPYERRR